MAKPTVATSPSRDDQHPVYPQQQPADSKAGLAYFPGFHDWGPFRLLRSQKQVACDRRGGLGATAAMFDDHSGGVVRLVGRCVADEERMVALRARQLFVLAYAKPALQLGNAPNLRGAGLARHFEPGLLNAGIPGRAAPRTGDGGERPAHDCQMLFVDPSSGTAPVPMSLGTTA